MKQHKDSKCWFCHISDNNMIFVKYIGIIRIMTKECFYEFKGK